MACRAQSGMRLRTGGDLDSESELERAPPLPLPAVAGWAPRIGAARGPPSCAECRPFERGRWDRDGAMKGPLPAASDPDTASHTEWPESDSVLAPRAARLPDGLRELFSQLLFCLVHVTQSPRVL